MFSKMYDSIAPQKKVLTIEISVNSLQRPYTSIKTIWAYHEI